MCGLFGGGLWKAWAQRELKKAIIVAVCGGWRISNDVVGDRTDKFLERSGECVNVGPSMGVNGGKKLVKRVGEDMLWRGWGGGV